MKKALSIILSVAMLMSVAFSSFVMPASAAEPAEWGYDFLTLATPSTASAGTTFEFVDGALVIDFAAVGDEVHLTMDTMSPVADFPYWNVALESEIKWDACLYDPNNSKWMFAAGDWCYDFKNGVAANAPINAGSENAQISVTGAYTWAGIPVETGYIKQITFIAKEVGKMTITKCAMTNGAMPNEVVLGSTTTDYVWDSEADLAVKDPEMWMTVPTSGSKVIITATEDTLSFGNTKGHFPSAHIDFETPYIVGTDAMLYVDFTVAIGSKTTIYLFFGPDTAFEYSESWVAINVADMDPGHYYGYIPLADILPEGADCHDENGNIKLTAIKIYATTPNDDETPINPVVTINALDLLWNSETVVKPAPAYEQGDVTLDGIIDMFDAFKLYSTVSGVGELTEEEKAVADVTGDGSVDMFDAFKLYAQVSGQ